MLGAMVAWAGGALKAGCAFTNKPAESITRKIQVIFFTLLSIAQGGRCAMEGLKGKLT